MDFFHLYLGLDLQTPPFHPALPPFASCRLARRGHPSGVTDSCGTPPPSPNLLAALVLLRPPKATESIVFIKGRSAISGPGASERTSSWRGLACQLEKWNLVWMNHWSVRQEWGRIECVVTAGRPSESMGEVRKAASAFVLTVTKGKKGIPKAESEKRHELVKCD